MKLIILLRTFQIGVKYLDLYLIHAPQIVKDYVAAWGELEKIREEGLAKFVRFLSVLCVADTNFRPF